MKRARVVDLIFDGLEVGVSVYDWLRKLTKKKPEPEAEPFPLTHRDAERIAEFGRRAGHEKN